MNKMQRKRFENLIQCTVEADKKLFNPGIYAHDCGAPACVIGNYVWNTKVQRAFVLKRTELGFANVQWRVCVKATGKRTEYYDFPIQDHFGLDEEEVRELFESDGCGGAKTPTQAVKYLKRFYKRKLKEDARR